jgi:hypothetical protein
MVAKRIRHLGVCDHAQTPYARRRCRAAKLAAAERKKAMEKPRYYVTSMNTRKGVLYYVIDTQNGGNEVYRTKVKIMAEGYADQLNQPAVDRPTTPTPAAQAATPRTGWSNAARRRAGHTERHHPLGTAVESGDGYTVYQDTAFGGGRVQIWDES